MLYRFEDYVLDTDRRELRHGVALLAIEPQVFDLLVFLVGNRDRLVSKEDLLASVWGGRIVSESTLASRINAVRRVVGDSGEKQRLIRTTIGKGIRFVGSVQEQSVATISASKAPGLSQHKPSIAVLPFVNMSDDAGQEYFVDGMVEEIITALSRIRWLFVLDRNSTFTYKGQTPDARLVGSDLGVRYVLEGSVRKAGNRVRITGHLIETASAAHLWADHFDGFLDDVFELQDKVASSVAGAIEPALQAAETVRSAGRPTDDLTAYDLYLRAYAMFWSSARQMPQALSLMEQAIAHDPSYGLALAWGAYCCMGVVHGNVSEDPATDRLKGISYARRALEVANEDPGILVNAAAVLARFGEDIDAMIALVDRALALNPNFARGWYTNSALHLWAGKLAAAISHSQASMRLSPRAPTGLALCIIGGAHFFARRFKQAVPMLLRSAQEDSSYHQPYRYLAACYAHMGKLDDAREIIAHLRAISPVVIPDVSYLRNPEHRERYLSGLRLAMAAAG